MIYSVNKINYHLDSWLARTLRAEFQANIDETRQEYAAFSKIKLLSIPVLFGINLIFIEASPHDGLLYIQIAYSFMLGILFHFVPHKIPLWFMLIQPVVFVSVILITLSILYVKYLAYLNFIVPLIFLVSFYFHNTRFSVSLMLAAFAVLAGIFYVKDFDDPFILWNLYFGSTLITGLAMYKVVSRILDVSQIDALTGLYNRGFAEKNLAAQYHLAIRNSMPLSLVYIDVDNFKSINDNYGHVKGDEVLRDVADSIRMSCRKSDIASRWGGDEFVIILPQTDLKNAQHFIDRLFTYKEQIEISCGLVSLRSDETMEQLLNRADEAMYQEKKSKCR